MNLKSTLLLSTLVLSSAAFAQAKAPEPDYTLSYNVGVVSDYRYRGISQSARDPALQGGIDFAHKSGFYLGTWASTIQWIKDSTPADRGAVEVDLYGGYKSSINDDFSYDVGLLQYWYPRNNYKLATGTNANTTEVYGALTYKMFTAKYSHALTDLFGTPNSSGSGYLDLSAGFDLGSGFTLTPHVGWQRIRGFGTYRDHALTLNKDFGNGFNVSAALVGTNWKSHFGTPYTLPGSGTTDLGKTSLVIGAKYNF
ncbi:TorF family putative porin [Ramlibacter humi]|uniref:Porin n=1 Tax=Ramlibacter humi TaxID=2530451 RepID=A0A4Z0BTN8_9BURK|nr:TorF family putative porin [Ramlibacter humi]TFZ01844.1 hypothetical protein EZ216_11680 [Ramlibacter humi]